MSARNPEPLRGVTSMATRAILAEIAAAFAARAGTEVVFEAMGGVEAARALREGLKVDLVALAGTALDGLIRDGFATGEGRIDYAVSGIAVAIPSGPTRPSIATAEDVRMAAAGARRVAISTGPSGDHVRRLLAQWGLDGADRILLAPPGVPVTTLLARGEADIGFQQLSEMLGAAGVEVLGPLPRPIAADTIFACAAAPTGERLMQAKAFLAFLGTPEARDAVSRGGMTPVSAAGAGR